MPILCLEGPSAVGKTATAIVLAETSGAYIVPEANVLFDCLAEEPNEWYLDRQVGRWALAVEGVCHHTLSVLDGDPFQPLWYNWAYNFLGWQDLGCLEAFYRPRLLCDDIGFPDCYIVLGADEETLRAQKEMDRTRHRRNFEKHLRFITPQRRYFEAMQRFVPSRVCFLDGQTVAENVVAVSSLAHVPTEIDPVDLFDHLVEWLRQHAASDCTG